MISTSAPLLETSLDGLTLHRRGKVRDVYELGDQLLIVTTDRISAFDYVLGSGIPDKGKVLTQLSAFWFERMGDLVPHHLVSMDPDEFPAAARAHAELLRGRTMLVRRTEPVPIECVARGYLSGSGWKEYQKTGSVCGITLPAGLKRIGSAAGTDLHAGDQGRERPRREHQRSGSGAARSARRWSQRLKALTLEIYRRGVEHAATKGHHHRRHQVRVRAGRRRRSRDRRGPDRRSAHARLVAVLAAGAVRSPAAASRASTSSSSATTSKRSRWNKQPPVPSLPDDVVQRTREKYVEAFTLLSGRELK